MRYAHHERAGAMLMSRRVLAVLRWRLSPARALQMRLVKTGVAVTAMSVSHAPARPGTLSSDERTLSFMSKDGSFGKV
jgi:hypothetical protein